MNNVCSVFNQLLQLFTRVEFQHMVKDTRAERYGKGFTCWGHALLSVGAGPFPPGDYRRSPKLRRQTQTLGISAPSHSTLVYANEHRPWGLDQHLFLKLFIRCGIQVNIGKKKLRFENKVISLDSSTIDLCLEMFDWARFKRRRDEYGKARFLEKSNCSECGILCYGPGSQGLG